MKNINKSCSIPMEDLEDLWKQSSAIDMNDGKANFGVRVTIFKKMVKDKFPDCKKVESMTTVGMMLEAVSLVKNVLKAELIDKERAALSKSLHKMRMYSAPIPLAETLEYNHIHLYVEYNGELWFCYPENDLEDRINGIEYKGACRGNDTNEIVYKMLMRKDN